MKEAKMFGTNILEEGLSLDQRNMVVIVNMKQRKPGDELQQVLCASNAMPTAIPNHPRMVPPLKEVFREIIQ